MPFLYLISHVCCPQFEASLASSRAVMKLDDKAFLAGRLIREERALIEERRRSRRATEALDEAIERLDEK